MVFFDGIYSKAKIVYVYRENEIIFSQGGNCFKTLIIKVVLLEVGEHETINYYLVYEF